MDKVMYDELIKRLDSVPNLYDTEEVQEPLCCIKLFMPDSSFTWYIIEFSKDDKDTCFGLVDGLEEELGYFTLSEIMSLRGHFGLSVELDLVFRPTKLSLVRKR